MKAATKEVGRRAAPSIDRRIKDALARLERHGSKKFREDMVARYGIATRDKTLGVSMARIQKLGKEIERDQALAEALWDTGVYEGRMLAIYVAEPERVTPKMMDRWARDFDNWAIADTACFKLFDQTPHAWAKIAQWAKRREEFVKRAAFALLACVALHDKKVGDDVFLRALALVEDGARDERNFVKKGVSWALRAVGLRNAGLRSAASELAERLAASDEVAARWVGKDALKALTKRKEGR
jgi:3-methyladenine DNA glycosylase AlkD